MTKPISRIRLLIFGLFITFLFWFSLDIATRVILSIQTKSTDFLLYGMRASQRVKHENIRDADGKILYHKCIPSKSKRNPVNSSGFRGKEIQTKKPDSTRIICLGGSTTYGLNLDYKDTYPKLLQDILDVRAGKNRYEVINAGMSALTLPKITSLAENEMVSLKPDIIILMSLINNLLVGTEWQKFSFFIIAGKEKNLILRTGRKLKKKIIQYSAFANLVDGLVKRGFKKVLWGFDWNEFSTAILSSETVWEKFESDLNRLLDVLFNSNPSIKVILVEQPVDSIDYPEMKKPFERAIGILRKVSSTHENVQTVNVYEAITDAQKEGKKVWMAAYADPVHFSRKGNEIIAEVLTEHLLSSSAYP